MARVAVLSSRATPPRGSWRQPVEWHARYSLDKLLALLSSPRSRGVSPSTTPTLLLAPLLSLLTPLLLELLPLDDPTLGWRRNAAFVARCSLRLLVVAVIVEHQAQIYTPQLTMPRRRMLLLNLCQGATMAGIVASVSAVTRVFPVPFIVITTAPLYVSCLKLLRWLFTPRADAATMRRLASDHERVTRIFSFDIVQLLLYSLFGVVFEKVPERFQSVMLVGLVALKVVVTRVGWRLAQVARVGGDDLATVQVAFGARVFHGLFTATCFQKSKSVWMLVAFVGLWMVYDLVAIREIQLQARACRRQCRSSACGRLECLVRLVSHKHEPACPRPAWFTSSLPLYRSLASVGRLCDECLRSNNASCCSSAFETEYLGALAKLFQQREATLLRFYVETFVPFVFFAFVATIKFFPNGKYMSFLISHDLGDLAWRLGISLVGKVATFAILLHVLHRDHLECGYPTGHEQLAFVLSTAEVVVLGRVILTTLNVFDFSLEHKGNDMSFQFKWLRTSPKTAHG